MSSPSGSAWPSLPAQEYAAAESMLEHSPEAVDGFAVANQSYAIEAAQSQAPGKILPSLQLQLFPQFRHPFQPASAQESSQALHAPFDGNLPSFRDIRASSDHRRRDSLSSPSRNSIASAKGHRTSLSSVERNGHAQRHSSVEGSEPTSPASASGVAGHHSDGASSWANSGNDGLPWLKDEAEKKPAWSDLKTKAGKDRKRLPLACIACRRKKIRCSGEKPACKYCLRSRIPCVYKVTTRKAAPRTDYMAMLDKRLKRMEERVVKIIPKEEMAEASVIPRATIRSSASAPTPSGNKRDAEEAFGPQLADWAESKPNAQPLNGRMTDESKVNSEGAEHLPPKEIQDHLSEVFFDCLYGQSYHLLHKPSYMRRLRAGTLPPVLILAVCAVAARFSTHPQINSEPAFLRGESWAGPARHFALKRYDEPNITILTVLLLLGLHEFGTCQGGRSWMFAGMATRMAYALQLHRELDHDSLGQKNNKKPELSFTDQEIRRRTMWACFLMDRFNSSGTERPMFADEETIKVQLPIKESHFQMEIPGLTESLSGDRPSPMTSDDGQPPDLRDNLGVAAYMIRIIALWGRVIKYLNMGGKEKDPRPLWDPGSQFADLKRQSQIFPKTLPPELQNTRENLQNHVVEKLGNQFLFMHIASNQVVLFLHRFAVPTALGGRNPKDIPKSFLAEAGPAAVDAANQISSLLTDAIDHHVFAPFVGYCAFLSSTVQVWGIFSKNPSLEASSKRNLVNNVKYLGKMKKHWGMFHFMAENLKDIYRKHADASLQGTGDASTQDGAIFQYGDWFERFPHGVSETDYEGPASEVNKESSEDAALSQKPDLQTVEEFFHTLSPPPKVTHPKKPKRKNTKIATQPQEQDLQLVPDHQGIMPISIPNTQTPLTPSTFMPSQSQSQPQTPIFPQSGSNAFFGQYDLFPLSNPASAALLPQLDRHLVYGAYAGNDPTASSSASALNALTNRNQAGHGADSGMWDSSLDIQHQQQLQQQVMESGCYVGDVQTSAWFMPFNLAPPEVGGDVGEFGRDQGGFGGGN